MTVVEAPVVRAPVVDSHDEPDVELGLRIAVGVYAVTAVWGLGFAVAAGIAQRLFLERRYDLGNFTQAVWSTAHGRLLEVTEVGGAQVSRLGIHVDPILLALVPLWHVWPSPVMLLAVQAGALAVGAVPLFWLGRKHFLSDWDAGLIVLAYLLAPAVGWNAFHEFHAVALAVPLLLFCVWFLEKHRLGAFAVAAVAAVCCQEQIGFTVGFLGIWYAWRHRRFYSGIAIALIGIATSAAEFLLVLPHFAEGGSPYAGRYASVGGSLSGIVETAFTDPLRIVGSLQPSDGLGVALLVVPVLGLCFRSTIMLVAIPQLALVILSDRANDLDFTGQTVLPIIPFIYAGAVFACAAGARRRPGGKAAYVLVASIAFAGAFGPLRPVNKHIPPSSRIAAERHAVGLIPAGASVSATNHLGAHLGARRHLFVFPVIDRAEWIAVDARDSFLPSLPWLRTRSGFGVGVHDLYAQPRLMSEELRRLNASPDWTRAYTSAGVSVFKRVHPPMRG
jgi:uncharacterized membrane protein